MTRGRFIKEKVKIFEHSLHQECIVHMHKSASIAHYSLLWRNVTYLMWVEKSLVVAGGREFLIESYTRHRASSWTARLYGQSVPMPYCKSA